MKIYDAKCSFAGGELSPLLHGRVDLEKYSTGVRELLNFIPLPQGGVCNRPGTTVLNGYSGTVRLVPFISGDSKSACLVFHSGGIDAYYADGTSAFILGSSPYKQVHLDELRWLQSNDILYLFHRDLPTMKLSRGRLTNWTLTEVNFQHGPYREMNTNESKKMRVYIVNLEPSGAPPKFQQRIGSNRDFFTRDFVGMFIKFETKVKAASGSDMLISYSHKKTDTLKPFGAFSFSSRGMWVGNIVLWRKEPGEDAFEAIKKWESVDDYNVAYTTAVEKYGTEYYAEFTYEGSRGGGQVEVFWGWDGGVIQREFEITDYDSPSSVFVSPLDGLSAHIPMTADWAVSAFGPPYGYPAMGIFHQERLILANTRSDPQAIWMSRPASWEDFETSIPTADDDAIMVTLASKQVNLICGLASRADLLVFTSGGEWVVKAGSKSDVFTPSEVVIFPSGYRGSAWAEPLEIGSSTLFIQRNARSVRGMGYELQIDGYNSVDMTILSEHLFSSNSIRTWCYQQEPWSLVWVAMADGTMCSLTLQQEQQVQAWARHDFGGKAKDACTVPHNGYDRLFLAVERDGQTSIEVLNNRDDSTANTVLFMDAGRVSYTSILETLDWEQQVNGTLQGRHKYIPSVTMRLYRTCGARAGIITENNNNLDQIRFGASPDNVETPYTGDVRLEAPGGPGRLCRLHVENRDPQPITILAIYPEVEINEG